MQGRARAQLKAGLSPSSRATLGLRHAYVVARAHLSDPGRGSAGAATGIDHRTTAGLWWRFALSAAITGFESALILLLYAGSVMLLLA